jgi:hypothetical protein
MMTTTALLPSWRSLCVAVVALLLCAVVASSNAAPTRSVIVAIKQSNVQVAERLLLDEISNVEHKNYGRYLTLEQLADLMAPASESVTAACLFLTKTLGASQCSLTHGMQQSQDLCKR